MSAAPNSNFDVSIGMTAPGSAGTYRGDWHLRTAAGADFGPPFWVILTADAPATSSYAMTTTVTMRTGPGTSFASAGTISAGTAITISCQTRSSSSVNGSTIWDLLSNGRWVSDYFTTTPQFNNFTPGLARC